MQEVTLAVLGGAKVGKSTFVQCALDMKAPPISSCTTKKVSLEGTVSVLRLYEFQLKNIKISQDCSIIWPRLAGDDATPRIDGALVLFDVMDQTSLYEVADLLSKSTAFLVVRIRRACLNSFLQLMNSVCLVNIQNILLDSSLFTWSSDSLSNAAIPTILISSKCDNNRKAWQIDQRMIERTCSTIGGIESFQTSASSPETHKRCVSIVLRKVLSARDGKSLNPLS